MPTWRTRRRGIFERWPRAMYRRTGARYFDAGAGAILLNGIAVAIMGVVTLVLYVDLTAGEMALFAAASVAGYVVEGVVAAIRLRRDAAPVRAWLAGARDDDSSRAACAAASRLALALLRRPELYAIGAVTTAAAAVLLTALLDLAWYEAALLLPVSWVLYAYSAVLRYIALELGARPVLEDIGNGLREALPPEFARVSLHRRLLATVPIVSWGTGVVVAGLLTEDASDLDTIGLAGLVAIAVTAVVSVWVSFVLADSVSGPVIDLRDATRRVAAGDLDVRVPVVSGDETGELAAAFNDMVAGLGERERLREAFGAFVDPSLTERVLREGTDLRGEEVEASILFLDVRSFTSFAERASAQDVVDGLNRLYEATVPVVLAHGGHANKLIGDGMLAVFGAPERHADHAARAVAAAREIAAIVGRGDAGDLRVGIGVSSGRVVAGTIGGGGRRDFTVIGDAVNTAARVEAATRQTGDDVLITDATRALLGDGGDWVERPAMPLKGKSDPVRLFAPARS